MRRLLAPPPREVDVEPGGDATEAHAAVRRRERRAKSSEADGPPRRNADGADGRAPAPADLFVVGASESGLRLDLFLARRIPRMSRASVQEAIRDRVELSSGALPKPSRPVHAGDVVAIRPRPVPESALRRERPPVLVEGDGWLVLDKPAGLASTPNASRPGEDVATLTGLSPAHRLDRFTSGCLLVTWEPAAARHFERELREHRARKEYLAVVRGVPSWSATEVSGPLEEDAASRVPSRMRVAESGAGQAAVTRFDVLVAGPDAALVRALPLTGRRHQVRVHLAHSGHPIVGDLLYGGDERDFVRWQLGQRVDTPAGLAPGRHLLHASVLELDAPEGGRLTATAPLPPDYPRWALPQGAVPEWAWPGSTGPAHGAR